MSIKCMFEQRNILERLHVLLYSIIVTRYQYVTNTYVQQVKANQTRTCMGLQVLVMTHNCYKTTGCKQITHSRETTDMRRKWRSG